MFNLTRSGAVQGITMAVVILVCIGALVGVGVLLYPTMVIPAGVVIPMVLVWVITNLFLIGLICYIHYLDTPPKPEYYSYPVNGVLDNFIPTAVDETVTK